MEREFPHSVQYRIKKEFHFSASHQLNGLPDDHQCARLHGHNYILAVELSSWTLDEVGFVLDYGELGFVKEWVDALDHRHLNDLFSFNPTSENICRFYAVQIAQHIAHFDRLNHIQGVVVHLSETPKTWAQAYVYVNDWRQK